MSQRYDDLREALDAMPVFPLPEVVLFPGALLPLHIFEPRYRALLQDCMRSHRTLTVAQIRPGLDADGQPNIAQIGGAGLIVRCDTLDDGRANIVLLGRAAVSLEELPFVPPYRRARARIVADLPDHEPTASDKAALIAAAQAFVGLVRKHDASFSFDLPQHLPASDLASACAQHLLVDARARQELLELRSPHERVSRVAALLLAQRAVVEPPEAGHGRELN